MASRLADLMRRWMRALACAALAAPACAAPGPEQRRPPSAEVQAVDVAFLPRPLSDAETLLDFCRAAARYNLPADRLDPALAAEAIARIHASVNWQHFDGDVQRSLDRILFALTPDNMVVGYVLLEPDGYIPYIATFRPCQGRGIGTLLMVAALQRARAEGLEQVYLHYRGNAPRTASFFAGIGRMVPIVEQREVGHYADGAPQMRLVYDATVLDACRD